MTKEKLTPADKKFITKFFGEVNFDTQTITRTNPYSRETMEVDPVFALMYDFVMKLAQAMEYRSDAVLKQVHPSLKMTNVVSNFDRARMIALKMDSNAYMTLLD
jgi:hypothetical protein